MALRDSGLGGVDLVYCRARCELAEEFVEQHSGRRVVRAVLEPEQLDPWPGWLSPSSSHGDHALPWLEQAQLQPQASHPQHCPYEQSHVAISRLLPRGITACGGSPAARCCLECRETPVQVVEGADAGPNVGAMPCDELA